MKREINYFETLKKECVELFEQKGFDTQILNDDDLLFDFLIDVDKNKIKGFVFNEKVLLYSYNKMLQTIAFSVDDVEYMMLIDMNDATQINKEQVRFEIIDGDLKLYKDNKLVVTYNTRNYERAIKLQKHFEEQDVIYCR
jgi:hypothetical protein